MIKNTMLTFAAFALTLCFLTANAVASEMDGVMMKDGKMMMMEDGKASGAMTKETMMSDGTKVLIDGTVMMKNGQKMQMKDGQMMHMDGKMMMDGGKMMEGK